MGIHQRQIRLKRTDEDFRATIKPLLLDIVLLCKMTALPISPTGQKALVSLLAVAFLLFSMTAPVMAQDNGDGDTSDWNTDASLICGDTDAASDTQVVFQYIIAIFMIMGFVFGLLMFAAEQFENSVLGEEYDILGDVQGKQAVQKGIMLPLLVYFFEFISEPVFGINISCIVPSL